jgi:hypothetical protein
MGEGRSREAASLSHGTDACAWPRRRGVCPTREVGAIGRCGARDARPARRPAPHPRRR